jgi:RNA polymerase sigma-70 factor (ECF subfamily)
MNAVSEPVDPSQVSSVPAKQHCRDLEQRTCSENQPSAQSTMKRHATCYKPGHPSHRPARTRVARCDRLTAFNQLVLQHRSMVYNLAYRILGDPELAAVATEKTFLRVSQVLPKSRGKSPKLWLMRIAVAICQEGLRQAPLLSSDSRTPLVGDNAHESVTAHTAHQPSGDGVQALLNALPLDQRVTLVLSDVQGLSYREIADVTGVTDEVIRSHLSQGRTALRNALLAKGEFPPGAQP